MDVQYNCLKRKFPPTKQHWLRPYYTLCALLHLLMLWVVCLSNCHSVSVSQTVMMAVTAGVRVRIVKVYSDLFVCYKMNVNC
jgi:TRAP-type C4-dicarboxylate transport system permease small subunit